MEKIKLLLYCTKNKKQKDLLWSNNLKHFFLDGQYNRLLDDLPKYLLNGKIVAECDFEVEEIGYRKAEFVCNRYYLEVLDKSCLTDKEMYDYLKGENGYAIHIKNLHIFDKPRELKECWANTNAWIFSNEKLYVAPQNMRYCGDWNLKKAILISIRPEWLCKILNGEKTIEVRKKVLKEMINNA